MKWVSSKQKGFTIVELLIVVVVIAILAAITVVAYNGIRNRAEDSSAKSTTSQFLKKMAIYFQTSSSQYPADAAELATVLNYTLKADDRYIVNNSISPAQYCLSIAPKGLATSYGVSSTSASPIKGVCVTNVFINPSFETSSTPGGAHYSATSALTTGQGVTSGASALQIHSVRTANAEAMRFIQGGFNGLGGFTPGTQYTISLDMTPLGAFASSYSAQRLVLFRWSGSVNGNTSSQQAPNSATTQRLFTTGTAPGGAGVTGIMIQVNHSGTASDPDIVIDSVMATEGSERYSFGDGSKPGWWWTGAANETTSVGPAEIIQ